MTGSASRRRPRRSRRTPVLALLVATAIVVAGCMADPDAHGDPDDADTMHPEASWAHPDYEVVLVNPLDTSGCAAVELLFEVPVEHAAAILPVGFHPAPSPVTGANAALTLELRTCAGAATESTGGVRTATLLVLVEPPAVPESLLAFDGANRSAPEDAAQALEFYALAAYTDGEGLGRLFRQSGVPWETGGIHLEVTGAGPAYAVDARVDTEEGDEALRATGTAAELDTFAEHRRVWRASDRGIQLFEELQAASGSGPVRAFGGSTCILAPGESVFTSSLLFEVCTPLAVRVTPAFDAAGRSYWFHGARLAVD